MKSYAILLLSAWILSSFGAAAQTTENFNSRPGVSLNQIKAHLQNHCWFFPDFDINRDGWIPGIEGDGAMVSGVCSNPSQNSGIYTPILEVWGNISISFKYKFNAGVGNGIRRWIKIYLVDCNNTILGMLDSVEFTGINSSSVYTYDKSFSPVGSAYYKVYINYQGIGGSTRIGIDLLAISASQVYEDGCNQAPVAVNDIINGNENRTASGPICANDYDPNGEPFTCYLITGSPHGTVTINPDNSFTFTPNTGFHGSSTSFTYQICDEGCGPLCSNIATVNIDFPEASIPVRLVDFNGLYRNNGNVEINWTTNFEQNCDFFEVERSLDGSSWYPVGKVKGQGISTIKKSYTFTDNVGRNTANKKDLYYRLKLVDLDKKEFYTRILVVRVYNTQSVKMISVTPNPAKNDITATIQLNKKSIVVLKVINTNGTELMRKTLPLKEGSNSVLLDASSQLKPGMYYLEVIVNSKERMMVKLIKE